MAPFGKEMISNVLRRPEPLFLCLGPPTHCLSAVELASIPDLHFQRRQLTTIDRRSILEVKIIASRAVTDTNHLNDDVKSCQPFSYLFG